MEGSLHQAGAEAARLVIVSNRVATGARVPAGGLAVALRDALLQAGNGLWFGWSGRIVAGGSAAPHLFERDGISFATLDLDADDYDAYYKGYSNRTLWPLFHYRIDLATFDHGFRDGYLRVNEQFAGALAPLLRPSDLVWVHDYHLTGVAEALRRLGVHNRVGFFLHTPFPAHEILVALPHHEALMRALFAYDLIGFQSPSDLRAFRDYVTIEIGGRPHPDGTLTAFGRTIRAQVFPIGIDTAEFASLAGTAEAAREGDRLTRLLPGGEVIIGVDRLDYTKGLVERFAAFEQLLEAYPDNRGRVTMLQIAPPSRSDVPEYADLKRTLEGMAGRVNGRFAELDWTPIRYLNRPFNRRMLAALYRASRVGLVTPFRDGMNLVAKEYVAAQSEADPGVLVLSRFAGAAQQLKDALIVNPYDVSGVAQAIQQGLRMGLDERRERWQRMMQGLREADVVAWRRSFVNTLAATPQPAPVRLGRGSVSGVGGAGARTAGAHLTDLAAL
jgi:trehalose 6-phosphate synthase